MSYVNLCFHAIIPSNPNAAMTLREIIIKTMNKLTNTEDVLKFCKTLREDFDMLATNKLISSVDFEFDLSYMCDLPVNDVLDVLRSEGFVVQKSKDGLWKISEVLS